MKTYRIIFWLYISFILAGSGQAYALDKAYVTGDKAWDKCSQIQEAWMHTVYDLVVSQKPPLKDVADISFKWRMTTLKVNSLKFSYLLKEDPGRIIRGKGLKAFMELDWFWDDSREFGEVNPAFLELEKEMEELEKIHSNHPKWPELKQYLRELSKSEEHKGKFDKFLSDLSLALRDGMDKTSVKQ